MATSLWDRYAEPENTFPAKCYPRFRYFQKNYESFLPDLQNVEEYANLYTIEPPEYKSLSDRKYDSVHVTIVSDGFSKIKGLTSKLVKVQVDYDTKISAKANDDEKLSVMTFWEWVDQQRAHIDSNVLDIIVFVVDTNDSLGCLKYLCGLKIRIPLYLSKERRKNVVFYDETNDISLTYDDMVNNGFQFTLDEDNKTSTLSSKIQYLLEYNVVSALYDIVKLICHIEEWHGKLQAQGKDFSEPDILPYEMSQLKVDSKSQFQDVDRNLKQISELMKHRPEEDVSKLPKVYVDNAYNRKLGRVGMTHGTAVVKKGKLLSMTGIDSNPRPPMEDNKQSVNELKKTMKTMKFEIYGLLKQTRIDNIRNSVPTSTYPELSSDLRKNIFKIAGIIGCGTEYDQLVMLVSRTEHPEGPPKSIKAEVKQLLQGSKFSSCYSIELIDEIEEFSFKQGDATYATQNTLTEVKEKMVQLYSLGTLGCFVNIKHGDTNKLFGITCAHCVWNCNPIVQINSTSNPDDIINGTRAHYVYLENIVDIAAIEISKEDISKCDKSLIVETTKRCENWTFEEGYPEGVFRVYKQGCKTGYTQGIMRGYYHFYSSVISSVRIQNSSPTNGPFSLHGDSGAVVWYEHLDGFDSDEIAVKVIGLVMGGNGLDSICLPIKHNIHALELEFGPTCQIKEGTNKYVIPARRKKPLDPTAPEFYPRSARDRGIPNQMTADE